MCALIRSVGSRTFLTSRTLFNCTTHKLDLLSLQRSHFSTSKVFSYKISTIKSTVDASKSSSVGSSQETTNENTAESQDSSKKKESRWTGKNAWKLGLISMCATGVIGIGSLIAEWGAPPKDENGKEIKDEFSDLSPWLQYPKRALREANFFKKMIQEPSSEKLLPDPLREPYYQPPFTLVLEMTGVLVHPDWTLATGWRFKKRPGVDYFLQQVGPPLFEVVIYTAEQGFTAFPLLNSLDPKGYIMYRLFRDATRWTDGHHVKDLNCLNRDLSKVIMIDHDKKAFQLNPRNGLVLKKWSGNDDDRTLFDLANFLRTIASSNVEDVRTVIEYYGSFEDPIGVFKENQRRLQEEQERAQHMLAEQQKHKQQTSGWLSSLTGKR